jgi:ribosomal protein S12 methylthiotransferase accessory factor
MVLSALADEDELSDGRAYLELFCYERDGGRYLTTLPFADPVSGRIYDVPAFLVRRLTGSNGMSAGNTLDEAMVQGLSELFEREVQIMMIEGRITPPLIPDDAIRQYSFFERIEEIRSDDRYTAELYDCSLGKGWPVVALVVRDLVLGTFGLRLGAHPSLPVAIERTLTEAAQGRAMREFATINRLGSLRATSSSTNRQLVTKLADGLYL